MRVTAALFASLLVSIVAVTHGSAQAPDTLGFQGSLTDSVGNPINQNGLSTLFTIYKNGVDVWHETQSVNVVDGIYNVYLGKVEPLDTVAFNQAMDLGIKVGTDAEMTPRTPLVAAAYALGLRGLYAVHVDDGTNKGYNVVGGAANNVVEDGVVGATISGGGGFAPGYKPNSVYGDFGTVGGGADNTASDDFATVGGGQENTADTIYSTVGGGFANTASGFVATVAGGRFGTASGADATVSGGDGNTASGNTATASGGEENTASGTAASVSGGILNISNGNYTTIAGGFSNEASGTLASVGGGQVNIASAFAATIGGGGGNASSGNLATIGGGSGNTASGIHTTVGGGNQNTASDTAAAVGGGGLNTASGHWATVPGGVLNAARGQVSLAAGVRSRANYNGSFVWQDFTATSDNDTLASTAVDQFLARASGGFFFYTGAAPSLTPGISLPAGSGTWTALSSEASKTDFSDVDALSYLDRVGSLELKEWSYKTEEGVTHVGPMAEDFYAAFGHGPTEKGISGVDGDGVALAAIQGLYELVQEQQAEIEQMRAAMARAGIE
jgi:hypothetical protein